MQHSPSPTGPLSGLRVVEISSFVAAPLGGMTLAQLGADVIRIDPLGGAADQGRWPITASGASLYWASLNKGKRSVTVDFRSPIGQNLISRLIAESGPDGAIVLTNSIGRGWLSYEHLASARPDLIKVQIQGYHDGSSAVDYTINAAVGFPLVTGAEGTSAPVNHVLPAWDVACGLYAALGVLAAERRRRISGVGEQINLALHDVALATVGNLGLLAEAQVNKTERERIGNHLYGGFARDFGTRDGERIMIVALTKRHWRDLVIATGTAAVFDGLATSLPADFGTDGDRYRYHDLIAAILTGWFSERTASEAETVLASTSVMFSRYLSFADLVGENLAELVANPMMATIDQPGIGPLMAPGSPLNFLGTDRVPVQPAPLLGADTDAVLSDRLGLSADDIAELYAQGVLTRATSAISA